MKFILHLICCAGLLFTALLPTHQYSWMQELDPTLSNLPLDQDAGKRLILVVLVLVIVLLLQFFMLLREKRKTLRALSALLMLAVMLLWFGKWQ